MAQKTALEMMKVSGGPSTDHVLNIPNRTMLSMVNPAFMSEELLALCTVKPTAAIQKTPILSPTPQKPIQAAVPNPISIPIPISIPQCINNAAYLTLASQLLLNNQSTPFLTLNSIFSTPAALPLYSQFPFFAPTQPVLEKKPVSIPSKLEQCQPVISPGGTPKLKRRRSNPRLCFVPAGPLIPMRPGSPIEKYKRMKE